MKKRSLTISIFVLTILAFASIGFASWIITNPNAGDEAEGTIIVDNVESEVYEIDYAWDSSNGQINFGKPSNYGPAETDWLTNDSEEVECLEAVLTISITAEDSENLESALSKAPISVVLSGKKGESDLSLESLSAIFDTIGIPAPVLLVKDTTGNFVAFDGTINFADLDADNNCVIKVQFSWGTNGNPYTYYNSLDYETYRVEAENFLKTLYSELTGVSYKLTIKG